MIYDFNDPASIAAWVRVAPQRHWLQLKAMVRLYPRFREPARAAALLLRAGQTTTT